MSTPLVALQKPKDISLHEIESELNKIWSSQRSGDRSSPVAVRAATFSMVVYEPEEFQQLLAALGFYDGAIDGIHGNQTKDAVIAAQKALDLRITGRVDPETLERLRAEVSQRSPESVIFENPDIRGFSVSEAIAAENPCRIITLCPTIGEDTGVTAQVSAYCPVQKSSAGSNLVCCEYITLRGTKAALERVSDLIESLLIPDLPKFVWWKATPNPEQRLFKQLSGCSTCIIVDSSYFSDADSELLKMQELIESGTYIADLNWHRLYPWQELTAATFDPPKRRAALNALDQVGIDYEKGNDAQALLYLGWIASRLNWQTKSYVNTGGDYDLIHVTLTNEQGLEVHTELAAIPTVDWGEISGDLVGIRLDSTTCTKDCCTILCSESTGCMRMESGGIAQTCHTELVKALTDQRAEELMSQQLRRWGRDVLFEESLAVTAEILKLNQQA